MTERQPGMSGVLDAKMQVEGMAISMCSEFIRNGDGYEKQDCEINAFKRLIVKLHQYYPRLQIRLVMDGLYAAQSVIELCEEYDFEYVIVLKDDKIPTLKEEYDNLVEYIDNNLLVEKFEEKNVGYRWVNDVDYRGHKVNILEQITWYKNPKLKQKEHTKWLWITSESIKKNTAIETANDIGRKRSNIEQAFKAQKCEGFNLEHTYSKDFTAMQIIYILLQIAYMFFEIIKNSDITGIFSKKYGSAKDFARKLLILFTAFEISDTEYLQLINYKIQIRFP